MSNQDIQHIIHDFVRRPNKETALLITGEWGCGKTYFLLHLAPNVLKKDQTICHISLKGISNLDDIGKRALLQIFAKKRNNTVLNKLINLIHTVDYKNVSVDLGAFSSAILAMKSYPNYLLIFDDLERLPEAISPSDVLLYLHSLFLENKDNNLIIVTNQEKMFQKRTEEDKKILDPLKKKFDEVKDKVIEREIPFEYNLSNNFREYLCHRYQNLNQAFMKYLEQSRIVPLVFQNPPQKNIRLFNSLFDRLLEIYNAMDSFAQRQEQKKKYQFLDDALGCLYYFIFKESDLESAYPQFSSWQDIPMPKEDMPAIQISITNGFLDHQQLEKDFAVRCAFYQWQECYQAKIDILSGIYKYSYSEVLDAIDFVLQQTEAFPNLQFFYTMYHNLKWINDLGIISAEKYRKYISQLNERLKSYIEHVGSIEQELHFINIPEQMEQIFQEYKEKQKRITIDELETLLLEETDTNSEKLIDLAKRYPLKLLQLYTKHIKKIVKQDQIYRYIKLLNLSIEVNEKFSQSLISFINKAIECFEDAMVAASLEILCNHYRDILSHSDDYIEKIKKRVDALISKQNLSS